MISSFSCLCPLLLFWLAPFLFEDSLAFQWGEWARKGLNSSRSMSFLCFSVMLGACDTLVLCSWTTGFCQECFLSGIRGRYRQQSGSISEGLEENFCAAESWALCAHLILPSLFVTGWFYSHGILLLWNQRTLALQLVWAGQRHIKLGNENYVSVEIR